jgi:CBS domain containing-hemolysin-like protein
VLGAHELFDNSQLAETVAPLILSPWVFVYCELLPKQLFYRSPNRLLRRGGPLLFCFTLLFSPVAFVLWVLGWLLEKVVGQAPLRVRLTLARKELQEVLQEGQEAGILHTTQRDLARRLFEHAAEVVVNYSTPLPRVVSVPLGAPKSEALHMARRNQSPIVPIRQSQGRELIGYVRVIDLELASSATIDAVSPLLRFPRHESHLSALVRMQSEKVDVAIVEDRNGNAIGLLYADRLADALFQDA